MILLVVEPNRMTVSRMDGEESVQQTPWMEEHGRAVQTTKTDCRSLSQIAYNRYIAFARELTQKRHIVTRSSIKQQKATYRIRRNKVLQMKKRASITGLPTIHIHLC